MNAVIFKVAFYSWWRTPYFHLSTLVCSSSCMSSDSPLCWRVLNSSILFLYCISVILRFIIDWFFRFLLPFVINCTFTSPSTSRSGVRDNSSSVFHLAANVFYLFSNLTELFDDLKTIGDTSSKICPFQFDSSVYLSI